MWQHYGKRNKLPEQNHGYFATATTPIMSKKSKESVEFQSFPAFPTVFETKKTTSHFHGETFPGDFLGSLGGDGFQPLRCYSRLGIALRMPSGRGAGAEMTCGPCDWFLKHKKMVSGEARCLFIAFGFEARYEIHRVMWLFQHVLLMRS